MKRRTMVVAAAGVMTAIAIANFDYAQAAAWDTVRSRGRLEYADGNLVVVDGDDIRYLHKEIKDLFDELPEHYSNHNLLTEE